MNVNKGAQRYRRVTDFGDFQEVENYIVAPMLGNNTTRNKKSKKTLAAVERNNDLHAVRKVENKIKANFKPKDWFVTFTYSDEHLPSDSETALRHRKNFREKLKRYCRKNNIEYKDCFTTEKGEKSGRWHHHFIMPGSIPYEALEKMWVYGTIHVKRLWTDGKLDKGKDRLNVHRLAEYFVGVNKKGKQRSDRLINKKRYQFSRNCVEPKVTYEPMSPKWLKTPRVPKGWELVPGTLEEYQDAYGLMHQRYTLVRRE